MNKNRGPEYFNMRAAQAGSQAQKIVETMALKPGEKVADLGSGGGYFVLRFAAAVAPRGLAYALDTNDDFLAYVTAQARQENIKNIVPVRLREGTFVLPERVKLDVLFSRNVYHHLDNRVEYFKNIKPFLNKGARLYILDHKKKFGFSFHAIFKHATKETTIISEMREAGYRFVKKHDFLAEQSFLEFSAE